MDGKDEVTVMERWSALSEPSYHPWTIARYHHGSSRRAQLAVQRRAERAGLTPQRVEQALTDQDPGAFAALNRLISDPAHEFRPRRIEVMLIGDRPFNDVMRDHPELGSRYLRDIPGYRVVYNFPGLTVRAEKLWPVLDRLAQAGVHQIELDHLRLLVSKS